jgi:hypothetical protein
VVETTVEIANKVGCAEVISRVVDDLKDESEPYRKMVMETVELVVQNLGASDIDVRLEEQLIDGILYAFQVSRIYKNTFILIVSLRAGIGFLLKMIMTGDYDSS